MTLTSFEKAFYYLTHTGFSIRYRRDTQAGWQGVELRTYWTLCDGNDECREPIESFTNQSQLMACLVNRFDEAFGTDITREDLLIAL